MIKGVNKRIIEVKETNSNVFESALLFVSPAYSSADEMRLKREADRVLQKFGASMSYGVQMSRGSRKKDFFKKKYPAIFLAGTVLGFTVALIIFKLF